MGIGSIAAKSPQAKGRIERLWNTFQDRLVTELRLAEASTMAEASAVLAAFLPRYNAQFAVPPTSPDRAYRPVPTGLPYEQLFCFKYRRTVAADNTVRLGPHRIQLVADRYRLSYARARVEIQVRMDGAIAVYYEDRLVTSEPAPPEAPVLRIQGSRVTFALPTPPPPVRPLSIDVAIKRMHRHTVRDGIMRPTDTSDARLMHGPNHPWRKPLTTQGEQIQAAWRLTQSQPEDKITDRLDGQNH